MDVWQRWFAVQTAIQQELGHAVTVQSVDFVHWSTVGHGVCCSSHVPITHTAFGHAVEPSAQSLHVLDGGCAHVVVQLVTGQAG